MKLLQKQSLFGKIFTINIITIIIGLLLSALLQYAFIIRLIDDELKSSLRENAHDIQRIVTAFGYLDAGVEQNIQIQGPMFRVILRDPVITPLPQINPIIDRTIFLESYLDAYTLSTGNYVILISADGLVTMSSFRHEDGTAPLYVSREYFANLTQTEPDVKISTLGIFPARMLTYSLPIIIQGETVGTVFVASPILPGMGRRQILMSVFLLPMMLVTVVSLIFSYILSRRITRPIKAISHAAKAFSKGEFKERVEVSGRDEIGELSNTFNQMAENLEKIENLRRTFVANVSHELRTPMTTIIGFIDGILDGTIPPESQSDYLTIVLSESRRLSRLISDLLDIARMEEDEFSLDITEFDINEMIRRCVIGFERRIDSKNISVNIEFPDDVCLVRADSDGISRVLTNLIDNAIKFTDQSGTIDIKISRRGNVFIISVRNTGEGIAAEDYNNIFHRFYKADKSRGLNREGTGLGLFIVKNILNLHGRDISVNSVAGEFTEFTFTLPSAE
ncbi:MAG: HAMP domain-containing histidine kinase [Oscillospiraceae bacterium]|nr:HAMP domain-containing histidine kinase [Oscillospiraceae bacterium]